MICSFNFGWYVDQINNMMKEQDMPAITCNPPAGYTRESTVFDLCETSCTNAGATRGGTYTFPPTRQPGNSPIAYPTKQPGTAGSPIAYPTRRPTAPYTQRPTRSPTIFTKRAEFPVEADCANVTHGGSCRPGMLVLRRHNPCTLSSSFALTPMTQRNTTQHTSPQCAPSDTGP
jgi:hypothetical protein